MWGDGVDRNHSHRYTRRSARFCTIYIVYKIIHSLHPYKSDTVLKPAFLLNTPPWASFTFFKLHKW